MMDDFEKHIRENKSAFEEYKADKSKLWANIESKLEKPEPEIKVIKLWNRKMLKVVAVIIIALGLFSVIQFMNFEETHQKNSIATQELNDIDAHYKGLIAYQVKLVNKSSQLTDKQKKEFLSFIDDLDIEYKSLKLELNKNLNNERVLEAIVVNYKKRIELIENLLRQINTSKKTDDKDVYIL
ncbi:hypothetical protein VOI54_14015 [Tamlana sp. 2201CG12-4]|uniref:hypothetical protein n=1 Tax=Tamlana sp. 2201CG12-4 TaxID=3112582 RepID=UPI002DB8DBB4|nr:hypothetical protein [Tamlana sp. 2201CG12-4]MEC3908142.1 hypothetical protein [Tamlana sp. 2201CG12-4]